MTRTRRQIIDEIEALAARKKGAERTVLARIANDLRSQWTWLGSTHQLQTFVYGYDFGGMDLAELTQYLQWNILAAQVELSEATLEFSWKPWAVDEPFVNVARLRDELVDVLHFVGNMLVAIGIDDEEFEEAYQEKQARNRARKASGTYSARKGGLGDGSDA